MEEEKKELIKNKERCRKPGTSLVVLWLRLCAPNARDPGSIPGQGTSSHMLQLKNPWSHNDDQRSRAATKTQNSQVNKFLKKKCIGNHY